MLNQCQFIGNLGRDPEVRTFQNGGKVCNLAIACTEKWKDRESGERKERTEWIKVAIFNEGLVRVAEQYLKKGSKVFVSGKMETRKWTDQEGVEKYSTEIALRSFGGQLTMLDSPGGQSGGGNQGGGYDQSSGGGYGGGSGVNTGGGDLDDVIPFAPEVR